MQFHHYAMEVRNLKESKRFYMEAFDFLEESSLQLLGEQISFLTLGGIRLELIENKALKHHEEHMHICFQVKNIKDTIEELTTRQLTIAEGPYDLENGWCIVFFEGPDGEMLEFLEVVK